MHQDDAAPEKRTRAVSGPPCLICHKPGAKQVTVRVALAEKVLADERMALCEACVGDRFRVAEAVRRIA